MEKDTDDDNIIIIEEQEGAEVEVVKVVGLAEAGRGKGKGKGKKKKLQLNKTASEGKEAEVEVEVEERAESVKGKKTPKKKMKKRKSESEEYGPQLPGGRWSLWHRLTKFGTEVAIDKYLLSRRKRKWLNEKLKEWKKTQIMETVSMENEDQFLYSHVEDEDFDERQLDQMEKAIKTQHPQVFRYFKELGRHHPNLAKTIAEALFTGIRQTGEEMGEWRFI